MLSSSPIVDPQVKWGQCFVRIPVIAQSYERNWRLPVLLCSLCWLLFKPSPKSKIAAPPAAESAAAEPA
jgi:hypothetical protein